MTYTINRNNGEKFSAQSMAAALAIARRVLGQTRIYRGAEYQTDRPDKNGDREYCTGLDIWTTKAEAQRENGTCAPIVISW